MDTSPGAAGQTGDSLAAKALAGGSSLTFAVEHQGSSWCDIDTCGAMDEDNAEFEFEYVRGERDDADTEEGIPSKIEVEQQEP